MLRRFAASALALGIWAVPAQAIDHQVIAVAGAFFPEVTYVQPGDTVTFINEDLTPRRIFGDDFNFVSPRLGQGESWTMTVVDAMPNDYFAKSFNVAETNDALGEGSIEAEAEADVDENGVIMRGALSFAPPPTDN